MTRGGTNSNWVTTAGHCGVNDDWFWHNGAWIHRMSSDYQGQGVDVALLKPEGGIASRFIWFGDANTNTAYGVTAKLTTWPAVGSAVYISGANSGLTYGLVSAINSDCGGATTVTVDKDVDHPNAGPTEGGDSGAPVVRWNTATTGDTHDLTAVGVHVCGNGLDTGWFTPIHLVEDISDSVVVVAGT
jgi:hypothetical protein